MGKHAGAVDFLLLLLCGCTSTVHLESQGDSNDVASFHIPSPKTPRGFRLLSPDLSPPDGSWEKDMHRNDDPSLLPVLQLCHPQGRHPAGFEGLTPQGLVLDKVYILVVSATSPAHHLPLPGLPIPPSRCLPFQQVSQLSRSEKVRTYPELVQDYKRLRGSKSGLGVFEMLPLGGKGCRPEDVSPFVLSQMIGLGEFLGQRYRQALPWLQEVGRDPVVAGCVPESESFQSTAALLHGLLQEKQFCRLEVKKLSRQVVRGLGAHQPCPAIAEAEVLMERAYREESGVLKDAEAGRSVPQTLYASLGVDRSSPAKHVARSLQHLLCGVDVRKGDLCFDAASGACFNLTQPHVQHLWDSAGRHNAYLSSHPLFRSYAVADTSPHIDALLAWFSSGAPSTDHAIKVDVADDFFFLKLLSALGHRLGKPIVPATRLVIEQYRKARSPSSSSRTFPRFWRVLVDGEVVTDTLRSCAGGAVNGLCGVDSLRAHLKDWVNSNMFGACPGRRDEL
ncbi:uncharacterized protein LOC143287639 [Babylonia areolata]|uniref:uncharacterized protein LOC143287639 n=1 Tax=Babylonia areolata TaxID=304850 RepID=UPI003FD06486